jgi:hypothetical protein
MRPIGGELELESNDFKVCFTDSGRSSIRLFLRSAQNRYKKYLLPNYFCEVIENIFIEEKIAYSFYNVFEDLSIDKKFINAQKYDVLYIINYFGQYIDLENINLDNKILLEDNVFFYNFTNRNDAKKWYAFNSYRKISTLADGSLIKTNLTIEKDKILKEEASFSNEKYEAKDIKYSYIYKNQFNEQEYLKKFSNAEELLDNQRDIYTISSKSLYLLLTYPINKEIREKRFKKLKLLFSDLSILKSVDDYSFFIMKLLQRDSIKTELMKLNIFLPVHWPKSTQDNELYNSVISVALFENYNDDEFDYLINSLKDSIK